MATKANVRRRRPKSRAVKLYRCGYIMNCPARGPGKGYRCMSCSLTMSA